MPNFVSNRPVAAAAAVATVLGLGLAISFLPAVHSRGWLLLGLLMAVGLHAGLGRALKAILSAVSPLASGAPEAAGYQRSLYGTPGRSTWEVVGAVLAAGVVLGVGITVGSGWLALGGLVGLAVALGLDLQRWERVATSADWVWFQRGIGQKVHQVAIENIRDISVHEEDAAGFTLRRGTRNRVCRLNLRMNDKRIVALPKTDAHADLDAVEAVANHIRSRQELMQELASRRTSRSAAEPVPPPVGTPDDEAMQRALRKLRRAAMADAASPKPPGG